MRWFFEYPCDGFNACEMARTQTELHERRQMLVDDGEACTPIDRIPREFLTDER